MIYHLVPSTHFFTTITVDRLSQTFGQDVFPGSGPITGVSIGVIRVEGRFVVVSGAVGNSHHPLYGIDWGRVTFFTMNSQFIQGGPTIEAVFKVAWGFFRIVRRVITYGVFWGLNVIVRILWFVVRLIGRGDFPWAVPSSRIFYGLDSLFDRECSNVQDIVSGSFFCRLTSRFHRKADYGIRARYGLLV